MRSSVLPLNVWKQSTYFSEHDQGMKGWNILQIHLNQTCNLNHRDAEKLQERQLAPSTQQWEEVICTTAEWIYKVRFKCSVFSVREILHQISGLLPTSYVVWFSASYWSILCLSFIICKIKRIKVQLMEQHRFDVHRFINMWIFFNKYIE